MSHLTKRLGKLENKVAPSEVQHIFLGEGKKVYEIFNWTSEAGKIIRRLPDELDDDLKKRVIKEDKNIRRSLPLAHPSTIFFDVDL